jgi:hypothetical protein
MPGDKDHRADLFQVDLAGIAGLQLHPVKAHH